VAAPQFSFSGIHCRSGICEEIGSHFLCCYHFSEIIMHPNLTISGEDGRDRALVLLQKAEALCLVSRALSITQTFEPRIQLGKPLHAR